MSAIIPGLLQIFKGVNVIPGNLIVMHYTYFSNFMTVSPRTTVSVCVCTQYWLGKQEIHKVVRTEPHNTNLLI